MRIPPTTRAFRSLFSAALLLGALAWAHSAVAVVIEPPGSSVQAVTSNSVTIYWQTDVDADATVEVSDGTNPPITRSISALLKNHTVIVDSLLSDTAYTYTATSTDGTDTISDTGAFSTPISTGDTSPPVLQTPLAASQCNAAGCKTNISFTANEGAEAQVSYGLTSPPTSPPITTPGYPTTPFTTQIAPDPPLTHATDYYYTIRLKDSSGNYKVYGPFKFTTCAVGTLLCFNIGLCDDGTALGECNDDGEYCNAGIRELNCSQCGYECQIGTTCKTGGACIDDPPITDTTYQCNPTSCYNSGGDFIRPAGAGCFKSWPKCNSNVVLKVRNDRQCKRWIDCKTAVEVTDPIAQTVTKLCTELANCAQIDLARGECSRFLSRGQCELNPARFCTKDENCEQFDEGTCIDPIEEPEQWPLALNFSTNRHLADIRYLTGAVQAGLQWGTGVSIQGQYPRAFAQQVGTPVAAVYNNNFEDIEEFTSVSSEGTSQTVKRFSIEPWFAVGGVNSDGETAEKDSNDQTTQVIVDREDPNNLNNPNHVLRVTPNQNDLTGARTPVSGFFSPSANENYAVSLRIKGTSTESQGVIVQLVHQNDAGTLDFPVSARKFVRLTTDWQDVKLIATNVSSYTWLQVVNAQSLGKCSTSGKDCTSIGECDGVITFPIPSVDLCLRDTFEANNTFMLDDVYIQPLLEAGTGASKLVTRSCRLYPREDSLICDYSDSNGLRYAGWHGYCLETDPLDHTRCVSWWPVDIVSGDSAALTSFSGEQRAGYDNRQPLYYCIEAAGNAYRPGTNLGYCTKGKTGTCNVNDDCDYTDVTGRHFDGICTHTGWWQDRPYITGFPHEYYSASGCVDEPSPDGHTFTVCGKREQVRKDIESNSPEYGLKEWDIESIEVLCRDGRCAASENPSFYFNPGWERTHATWGESDHEFTRFVVDKDWANPEDDVTTLHAGEVVWSFAHTGSSKEFTDCPNANCIQFNLIFDPKIGLIGYRFAHRDNQGDNEGGAYDVVFHLREYCRKVVEVVDATGQNIAWTGRVASNSNYRITQDTQYPLNYTYTQDFAPFGAIIAPTDGTPEEWDGDSLASDNQPLPIERPQTNDPNPNKQKAPNQARGGYPYACVGDCSVSMCVGMGGSSGSPCRAATDCAGTDAEGNAIIGQCMGVGLCESSNSFCTDDTQCPLLAGGKSDRCIGGAASSKGLQSYSPNVTGLCINTTTEKASSYQPCNITAGGCPSGEVCTDRSGQLGEFSVRLLQRLFAQSYGVWLFTNEGDAQNRGQYVQQKLDNSPVTWSPPTRVCAEKYCEGAEGNIACQNSTQCSSGVCTPTVLEGIRPQGYNPLYNEGDYCGVPPRVYNVSANDKTSITIDSGETFTLKFNTSADKEQLPLSTIFINWDRDEANQGLPFPFAPRDNANNPHIFTHAYTCSITDAEYDSTPGVERCIYKPKILVRDNWGFCNSYWNDAARNANNPCNQSDYATWAPNAEDKIPGTDISQEEVIVRVNPEPS